MSELLMGVTGPDDKVGFFPADVLTNPVAVYGLRLLKANYSGECCNIRRSSDNATQDIGFVSNNFDTAAFSAFVGGGNGFVTKWYDQSGNGFDATQGTNAAQPQLLLNQQNGHPALSGSGSQNLAMASITQAQPITAVLISDNTGTTGFNVYWIQGSGPTNLTFGRNNAVNNAFFGHDGIDGISLAVTDNAFHQMIGVANGASTTCYVDGASTAGAITANGVSGSSVDGIFGGAGGGFMVGLIAEAYFCAVLASAGTVATLHTNATSYWGTP